VAGLFSKGLLFKALFVAISLHCGMAFASSGEAQKFVEKVSQDAIDIIALNADAAQKEQKLSELFLSSVDTKWIARFVMGKYWNQASEEQKAKYLEVHRKFLVGSYVPKFKEYNNQQIKVTKSSDAGDGEYLVESKIVSADGAAINVDYKVRKGKDGKYMVFDVIAEGISLITTERADFASILSRDGIDSLISMLAARG
jgi:phospholipid transport system substrate-binding protein